MNDDLLDETRPSPWKRLGWVAVYAGFYAACAAVLAFGGASIASRSVPGFQHGDAVLFEPGGLLFAEATRKVGRAIGPSMSMGIALHVLASMAALLPLAALIAALATRGRPIRRVVAGHATKRFGTLLLMFGVARVVEAILVTVLVLVFGKIVDALHYTPPREDIARVASIGVALLITLVFGVVHDLARVATVTRDLSFSNSVRAGFRAFGKAPFGAVASYFGRSGVGWIAIAAASYLVPPLAPIGAPLILIFIVHQGAFFVAALARAWWLAAAIGLVARASVKREDPITEAPVARVMTIDAPVVAEAEPTVPSTEPAPRADVDTTWKSPADPE